MNNKEFNQIEIFILYISQFSIINWIRANEIIIVIIIISLFVVCLLFNINVFSSCDCL
jgi:hypothetical protein